MSDLILHHYPGSPFSEKIRLILGSKQLSWHSVVIPVIMPKPDLVALTGGYRKTPVLQIGADVYCDTALIARTLESFRADPTLYPSEAPLAPLLAQWADSVLFWTVIPYVMQPAGITALFGNLPKEAVKAFAADRATFTAGMTRKSPADAAAQLRGHLAMLDAQLERARPYLFGAQRSIADFAVAHCLWYIRRSPPMTEVLDRHARLSEWLDRMLAIGHGSAEPLDSAQALAVSAGATGHAPCGVPTGAAMQAGAPVLVMATDYGTDPVEGSLVGLSDDEIVIAREDARAGKLHVHFPRFGYALKAAGL